jgi:hypothetical protein
LVDRWGRGCSERAGAFWVPAAGPCSASGAVPLRVVWVAPTGGVETAVCFPTDPVAAVVGLICASSSPAVTVAELLAVALSPRLVMWTSTEIPGWPNLGATRVAAAFGRCRDMVCGTAVFTGGIPGTPASLSITLAARVRDLT